MAFERRPCYERAAFSGQTSRTKTTTNGVPAHRGAGPHLRSGAIVFASEPRSIGTSCSESGPKMADGIVQISNLRSFAPGDVKRNENPSQEVKGALPGLCFASMPSTFPGSDKGALK